MSLFINDFIKKELDDYLHRHGEIADALLKRIMQSERERKDIAGIKKIANERAKKANLHNKKLRDCRIHLTDSKKHLTNYLSKRPNFDILKLLLSNKTVLVEGTTEEMLINATLYRNNENVNSLEVISIEQTGFTTFMDVWLQVNKGNTKKRLSIIRDYDENDTTKNKHEKYDADNDIIVMGSPMKGITTLRRSLRNAFPKHVRRKHSFLP